MAKAATGKNQADVVKDVADLKPSQVMRPELAERGPNDPNIGKDKSISTPSNNSDGVDDGSEIRRKSLDPKKEKDVPIRKKREEIETIDGEYVKVVKKSYVNDVLYEPGIILPRTTNLERLGDNLIPCTAEGEELEPEEYDDEDEGEEETTSSKKKKK